MIKEWLDGVGAPAGLTVDTDLRWLFVQRLAALGAADDDMITAEQDRDDTITGREMAANARAARPDADAKAAAWQAAVHDDDTPNGAKYQTIAGLLQVGQEDLQETYAKRYFAEIADVWANKNHDLAQNIAVGLYPRLLVRQQTVDRTNEWLASADPPPALRRLVVEGRDRIERALRCQAKDSEVD